MKIKIGLVLLIALLSVVSVYAEENITINQGACVTLLTANVTDNTTTFANRTVCASITNVICQFPPALTTMNISFIGMNASDTEREYISCLTRYAEMSNFTDRMRNLYNECTNSSDSFDSELAQCSNEKIQLQNSESQARRDLTTANQAKTTAEGEKQNQLFVGLAIGAVGAYLYLNKSGKEIESTGQLPPP